MDIHGIGPGGAARILADVGDVARFPNRAHFASWTGTAPIDASSGQHRPDQRMVISKQLCVETFAQPPDQGRRALNIGKQKRESPHGHSLGASGRSQPGSSWSGHPLTAPAVIPRMN